MINWLVLVTLMGSAAFAARPRQVEFKNVPETLVVELRKKLPQVFTSHVTYADLDELLQALMASDQFEDVAIESDIQGSTEKIQVTGKRIRRLAGFTITGAEQLGRSEVRALFGLQAGSIFNRRKFVEGSDKLKARYGEMGFLNTAIEVDFQAAENNDVIAAITIDEREPCLLSDIQVETPNRLLYASLMRRIGRQLRRPLTEQRVLGMREAIDTYFSDNRFLNAQVSQPDITYNSEKTRATVTFHIENPERYELIFDGNSALTGPTLLRSLNLANYPRTTANPALDITNRLIELYRERGYAFTQVDYREKRFDKLFLRRVYYKIKENKRVRISELDVRGNLTRESSYYARFIRENSTDVVSDGFYNRAGLDQGIKNLQIELQNQGFLRAKISSVRINFSENKQNALVTVHLDEGPQTLIREILFKGNTQVSSDQLRKEISIQENQPLNLARLEESLQTIKDYYYARGFLEMSIANEHQDLVAYNEDNTQASIILDLKEGPEVHIERVVLEGNSITKDYVILREVELNKGDLLTPEKIAETTGRLQRLGLFSTVNVTTVEQGTPIANRTVVISVQEGNPGLFNSGLGFTDEANLTYRGYLGLAYRNIGGTARAFSSRVELNYASDPRISSLEHKIQLAYLEPFIFDTRNRARVAYTRAQFVSIYDFTKNIVKIQQSDDARMFLERDLSLHTKLTWTLYGLERSRFFEKNNQTPETDRFIATVGPTLDVDFRDNPFNPMHGSFTRLAAEYSDPSIGSDHTIKYIKADAQYTKYHRPFGNRIVWANQVRGGYLSNLSTYEGSGVPFEKAFFLGGRSTVRGFEPASELFPRKEELNYTKAESFDLTNFVMPSRSQYFLVKSEVRFPIYGNFGGAVFYDGGAVYIDGLPIEDPYRDAIGAGLRFSTPVGPVNLEFGYKLDRKNHYKESPYRIHFSIGTF